MRFLSSPPVIGTVAIAFVFVAAETVHPLSNDVKQYHDFLYNVINKVALGVLFNFGDDYWFRQRITVPKDSVIDKCGYLTNDPLATIKMLSTYRQQALGDGAWAIMFGAAGIALKFYSMAFAEAAVRSLWNFHAARKLRTGKWTIQTTPPGLQEKQTTAVPEGATAPASQRLMLNTTARLG